MFKYFLLLLLFVPALLMAQSPEEDSALYTSAFQWLDRKLTYNYFDASNQQWWVNQFQENMDGSITTKNIAAVHPEKILEKVYYFRTFFLYDLNPRSIQITNVPEDQGRFVKGKMIRIEAFGSEKPIKTKSDGVTGSQLNFLHISIPEFLEDSLQGYAFQVKEKIAEAAALNARLYKTNDFAKNIKAVFSTLHGNFINKDSTAYLEFEVLDSRLVRFIIRKEESSVYGSIGYDAQKKIIFYFQSYSEGYLLRQFLFDEDSSDLVLNEGDDRLVIIGRNTLEFFIEGKKARFYRY